MTRMTITNNAFDGNERAPSYSLTRAAFAWLRSKLKQAITFVYAWGIIDAATAQRLIDRFQVWSD
jgi:hypothetical protein